jgi:MFS family permease
VVGVKEFAQEFARGNRVEEAMNNLERAGQRTAFVLLLSQGLFSASSIIVFTVGSIIVVQLADGNSRWTGVPSTLALVGAAVVVYPMGRLMDRAGRRVGLSLGYFFGIAGALITGWAIVEQSLSIFLVGVLLAGLARGVIDMGRYAAAEASRPGRRAQAISLVVLGGTVGSIVGPSLTDLTTNLAQRVGLPGLSGPWFAAGLLLALALMVIYVFLRPDPQTIARHLTASGSNQLVHNRRLHGERGRTLHEILRSPSARLAMGAMVFSRFAMVSVMTVTAVHMHGHQHEIGSISWVIMAHTLGMFGLSFVTGWLADRLGRATMIAAGGLILALACLMAPLSTGVAWLAVALFLLGLGWNFCFVAGSALLDDVLRPPEKGRVQGMTETMINVASGVGSMSSGLIFAALGFATTSWANILIAMIPVMLVVLSKAAPKTPAHRAASI